MQKYEKVAQLENEIQAQLLESILQERDIPHLIRSYHDLAYDGLYQTYRGWGYIEAPSKFKQDIISILEEIQSKEVEIAATVIKKNVTDIPEEKLNVGSNAFRQVLIGPNEGPNFSLRRFVIKSKGDIPAHSNTVEHEQYVLSGRARIGIGEDVIEVNQGDVILIPEGIVHWYKVLSKEPFEFLCIVPNKTDEIKLAVK